jgi:cation transporter-like permease
LSLIIVLLQVRCENILRNRPGSRSAAELHLAAIESQEEQNMDNLKKVAMNSGVALAAVGAIAGVVGFLLTKR